MLVKIADYQRGYYVCLVSPYLIDHNLTFNKPVIENPELPMDCSQLQIDQNTYRRQHIFIQIQMTSYFMSLIYTYLYTIYEYTCTCMYSRKLMSC